jgi:hypothetical protein
MKRYLTYSFLLFFFISCQNNQVVQIDKDIFVFDKKVYKIIGNELIELANIGDASIRKPSILKPKEKNLGVDSLTFIKKGAYANMKTLYRENFLYFKLYIKGINDLRENYKRGSFTIHFVDEYYYVIHSIEVKTNDLIGIIGDNGNYIKFEYNAKIEISNELNNAIKGFSVSSTVKSIEF